MSVAVSYPGVYVEEIPSGVRTITGVATSIAAFVGWAPKGPTNAAGLVLSFSDFVRDYGGLDSRSLLGYAVSHFFANGGQQAYVVRLASSDAANGAASAKTDIPDTTDNTKFLEITANSPGKWATSYGVALKNLIDPSTNKNTGRFRLQIYYNPPAPAGGVAPTPALVESFENLSISSPDPSGRYVLDIVNSQSNFVTASVTGAPAAFADIDAAKPQAFSGAQGKDLDGKVLRPAQTKASSSGDFETALLADGQGVSLLEHVDLFNILCVPGETDAPTIQGLETFCRNRRAIFIADCASDDVVADLQNKGPSGITGGDAINAAYYFPWLNAPDPLGGMGLFPPCGFVAGIYASTDGSRGVWKAPAGTDASLTGVSGVSVPINDKQNGLLNPYAVNCIRNFPVYGVVVWGARTLRGNDEIGSEWKYLPVRRTALFIEESLYRGLKWVVFEPNDEPLWSQIRLNVGAFMQTLFRQGAFQGKTPQDAYFVKCDKETTTQNDINLGVVNIIVGFAPLKPAEFVVLQIQQIAGQIAT